MPRVVPVLLILLAAAVAAGLAWIFLAWSFPGARGEVTTERRALPPFTRIAIEGLADATLVQGTTESVTIEAPSRQLPRVRTEVTDGTLTIGSSDSRRWWSELFGVSARPARVTVAYRELEGISATGAVKIRAERLKTDRLKLSASGATSLKIADLDTKLLSLSGSGAMKAEVAGRATEQRIAISGAGDYRATDLVSEDARVAVSGAGNVAIRVEKTLRVGITGAGSVEYIGDPTVTQQISGAGRVKRREAAAGSLEMASLFPAQRQFAAVPSDITPDRR
jgi:hypothetical protein